MLCVRIQYAYVDLYVSIVRYMSSFGFASCLCLLPVRLCDGLLASPVVVKVYKCDMSICTCTRQNMNCEHTKRCIPDVRHT